MKVTCTLILSGEADLSCADDITQLGAAALQDPTMHTLLINLRDVTFIDSTTIGALVKLRNLAEGPDKNVVLVQPSARVSRVLEIAGLHQHFNIV